MSVDYIINIRSNSYLVQWLITQLNSVFSLKQLGELDYFLGLEVRKQASGSLLLTQTKYLKDLLSKPNMLEANAISTPMISNSKLTKTRIEYVSNASFYRSIVRALQYATITRLEINFVVNKVFQFMAAPQESHWAVVKRILWYLKGTLHYGLIMHPLIPNQPFSLTAYYDAYWIADLDDRRSTSGATIFFGANLVSW